MAAKKKPKFYAVKAGVVPGVYLTWEECESMVRGFPGADYKSFATMAEADDYVTGRESTSAECPPEGELYAYVDGSFNSQTGVYGYGIVFLFPDGHTEETQGGDCNPEVASMRNVAGELKGAMLAMQYAVKQQFSKLTIFHDYEGIAKWATGEWKANLEATRGYSQYARMISSRLKLSFCKVAAHTGVLYNEQADLLAKAGAGISE